MSMQTTAGRAVMHIVRAGQNNPQIFAIALPVLAVAGLAYGACKLYDYLEQKQADALGEAVEARRAALPSGEK